MHDFEYLILSQKHYQYVMIQIPKPFTAKWVHTLL